MEQNNLIVTPDGKTWDEVTRDVGYIGNTVMQLNSESGHVNESVAVAFDTVRGYNLEGKPNHFFNKDFALAYDRQICLRDGEYEVHFASTVGPSYTTMYFKVNGVINTQIYNSNSGFIHTHGSTIIHLKRGDYVQIFGGYWYNNETYHNTYYIRRLA
jgi:hypothetical protein